MLDEKLKHLPPDRPIVLDNVTCVFCGELLTPETATKEHVIGRRFVPKGKFENSWNLIVQACHSCNNKKSDLEDDISAITMQPTVGGEHHDDDEILVAEAKRKGKNAFSRRTKKPVKDSHETVKVNVPLAPGANMTLTLTSAPQLDEARVYELAGMQLCAFFYFITYNPSTRKGAYWRHGCYAVMGVSRLDWGNAVHKAFMNSVADWEPRFLGHAADAFFSIIIRRHPTAECWSWGLEWNKSYRLVGFFGDKSAAQEVARAFPVIEPPPRPTTPDNNLYYRREITLHEDEDLLFLWNTASETKPA